MYILEKKQKFRKKAISSFAPCLQVTASVVEIGTVADNLPVCATMEWSTLLEWSFSENGPSNDADMLFENRKITTYPIIEKIDFRPFSQVMESDVGMRIPADTLPDCSILGYFHLVKFLRKWP